MPGQRATEATRHEQILNAAFVVAVRDRLDGLTIRAVAKQAGLSSGLVHFHFTSRDTLLLELLDWLLERTIIGDPTEEILSKPTATLRLTAFLRQEFLLLPERRARLELFFDFWVAGMGNKKIRERIRRALEVYRSALLPLAEEVVREAPERFPDVSGIEFAGLVLAVIQGFVMQAIVDPQSLDLDRVFASVQALVLPVAAAGVDRVKVTTADRGVRAKKGRLPSR